MRKTEIIKFRVDEETKEKFMRSCGTTKMSMILNLLIDQYINILDISSKENNYNGEKYRRENSNRISNR